MYNINGDIEQDDDSDGIVLVMVIGGDNDDNDDSGRVMIWGKVTVMMMAVANG